MNFSDANVKGIKADIAKKRIVISFEVDMDKDNLITADELSLYVGNDSGYVDLSITPRQLPLKAQVEEGESEAVAVDTDPGTWEQSPVAELPAGEIQAPIETQADETESPSIEPESEDEVPEPYTDK